LENAVLSLLFIPHDSIVGVAPVLWQGWTLEYEMFFYALCAVALFLPAKNRLEALCALLILLVVAGAVLGEGGPLTRVYTNPLLLEFVAGVGLAGLWRRGLMPPPIVGAAAIVLGLVLFAVQAAHVAPLTGARALDWGAPALLLAFGALSLESAGRVPMSRAGLLLGDASYSLYLTHGFVVAAFVWFFADAPLLLRILACTSGAAVVAICSYLWFERPVTAMLKSIRLPVRARAVGS
jgi:exopolysaccharide production protein ExoZ